MMGKKRLLSCDNGIATYHEYDHEAKKTIYHQSDYNVQSLLNLNQRRLNDSDSSWKGDMHHVASIPRSLYEQWWREFGGNPMSPEHRPKLMAKLQDRDFSRLRTKSGAI